MREREEERLLRGKKELGTERKERTRRRI